jgi:hypothetical protein
MPQTHPILQRIKAPIQKAFALFLATTTLSGFAAAQTSGTYTATNLISDGSVAAAVTDPNFINPWGVSIGPAFWINTQATGFNYVATAAGTIPFKVTIPSASGSTTTTGLPSGTVFVPASANGLVLPNGSKSTFLFATLDGSISGWNSALGTANSVAQIVVNNSANNAVYTDMALLTNPSGTFILAANFGQGQDIEVYNSSFASAKLNGNFTDPTLPAGYAPFAVHVIGSQVFVTYALQTVNTSTPTSPGQPVQPIGYISGSGSSAHPAVTTYIQTVGPGNGIVSVFDLNGNFVSRAVTGGNLNAPWGVAIAPAGFGIFGGDLLVGNFGDGIINVYNPTTFAFLGQLTDGTGKAISYPSLWEIVFGESNQSPAGAGDPNTLYIAAGLANEAHGLFAAIANSTSSTAAATFGFSASTAIATVAPGASTQATISIAPTNSFSGTVNLACSAPTGITCTLSSNSLTVSPTAASTTTVTLQAGTSASIQPHGFWKNHAGSILAAFLLPFGSLLAFSRKRIDGSGNPLRLLGLAVLLLASTSIVVGCSSSTTPTSSTPTAPIGAQMVTVTATSGAISQTTTIALSVQ